MLTIGVSDQKTLIKMAPLLSYTLALVAASQSLMAAALPSPIRRATDAIHSGQDFLTGLRHHRGIARPDDHDFHFYGPGPVLNDKPGKPDDELDPYWSEQAHNLWEAYAHVEGKK